MNMLEELEKIEDQARKEKLRKAPHMLHPAGGLTENFVYEPVSVSEYVYKTRNGEKGLAGLQVEFEDEERRKGPHWFLEIGGERHYFSKKPPKEWLFKTPDRKTLERWIGGEKQSVTQEKIWNLNSIYLETFLDFPHEYEFSVTLLFIQQTWLSEILPVVFYLGVKGEFGGGKTVTGEAITSVCRHGYLTGNLSPPFVARAIQDQKITLMVDELDSIAGTKDSDLNSIFRQGYRRGLKYSRVNPNTLEVESYLIFGPKLFTVHSEIEQALQTRTVPIHVRETDKPEYPIVNMEKEAFSNFVYTENFLWYMDNILTFRDNEMHVIQGLADPLVDMVDIVDPKISDPQAGEHATKIREKLYSKKRSLITEGQLSQLCQLTGRNIELMYMCFLLSNIIKVNCSEEIVKTFQQKIIEEGERTELGYLGILKEVLTSLWKDKKGKADYTTENGFVKISNKEIYDKYNEHLKKSYGQGVSPAKFKEFLLEFGFTDALNRAKLKVPIPEDSEAKSRLCNIFTDRVLRKLGIQNGMNKQNHGKGERSFRQIPLNDVKAVYWADKFYDTHECCICGYRKLTSCLAETFKGDKIWICEDCKHEWEKRRNNVD